MDVDHVADELYALAPEEFTAVRDARAAEAKQAGDGETARAVKQLRRPTASAWLVNVLARRRADQLADLVGLGAALREAQESLAGDQLRELTVQRHQVVAALAQEVRRIAYDEGHPVSDDVAREVEGTLEAALADPGAAEAVQAGRLTRALSYAGIGAVDLTGSVAVPAGEGRGQRATAGPRAVAPARPAADRRAEQLAAAREAVTAAEEVARDAEAALAAVESAIGSARVDRDAARERIALIERQLAAAQEAESQAGRRLREAQRDKESAARGAEAAERRLTRARAQLERLEAE
ncbi:MAG: hypothetical protein ACJ74O_00305 [Frankiaceae bacterium]